MFRWKQNAEIADNIYGCIDGDHKPYIYTCLHYVYVFFVECNRKLLLYVIFTYNDSF